MRGSRAALNFPSTDYSADNFMKVGPHLSAWCLHRLTCCLDTNMLIDQSSQQTVVVTFFWYTGAEVWAPGQDAIHHEAARMGSGASIISQAQCSPIIAEQVMMLSRTLQL